MSADEDVTPTHGETLRCACFAVCSRPELFGADFLLTCSCGACRLDLELWDAYVEDAVQIGDCPTKSCLPKPFFDAVRAGDRKSTVTFSLLNIAGRDVIDVVDKLRHSVSPFTIFGTVLEHDKIPSFLIREDGTWHNTVVWARQFDKRPHEKWWFICFTYQPPLSTCRNFNDFQRFDVQLWLNYSERYTKSATVHIEGFSQDSEQACMTQLVKGFISEAAIETTCNCFTPVCEFTVTVSQRDKVFVVAPFTRAGRRLVGKVRELIQCDGHVFVLYIVYEAQVSRAASAYCSLRRSEANLSEWCVHLVHSKVIKGWLYADFERCETVYSISSRDPVPALSNSAIAQWKDGIQDDISDLREPDGQHYRKLLYLTKESKTLKNNTQPDQHQLLPSFHPMAWRVYATHTQPLTNDFTNK